MLIYLINCHHTCLLHTSMFGFSFGAVRGNLSKNFQADIFISGFFGNALLAAGLAYLGDKLGIPIYMAAVIVFGGRIFDNFAIIRRLLLEEFKIRRRNRSRNNSIDKENHDDK